MINDIIIYSSTQDCKPISNDHTIIISIFNTQIAGSNLNHALKNAPMNNSIIDI